MSGLSPESSAIKTDAEFEALVSKCETAEQIKALMADRAVQQNLVKRDIYSPDVLIPVEAGTQPREFATTVTINGVKTILQAPSEEQLRAMEIDVYRQALSGQPAAEQPRDEAGRFVPQLDNFEAAAESDLVNRALQAQGIDPEALREFTANREAQTWEQATESFRQKNPGWIGGQANVEVLGNLIVNSPEAMQGKSPLECLELAYKFAVENDLLVENREVTQYQSLANANSPEELRRLLGRDSSLFGR